MYLKAAFRIGLIILNHIYCLPTYVIWMTVLQPMKLINEELYYRIEGLFCHWMLSMLAMWTYTAGYGVIELGDDITPLLKRKTRTLIIANHQSTSDVSLLITAMNAKPGVLPNLMWIMLTILKYYCPNRVLISKFHNDFFIDPGRTTRDASVQSLKEHITNTFIPRKRNWMVLFPEGALLFRNREKNRRYAEKNNLPQFNHLLLPRFGALRTILSVSPPREPTTVDNGPNESDTAPCYFDYILDITIAYPKGQPLDITTIVTGTRDPCETYFLYRLYPTSQVPKTDEALTAWMLDRWTEKEQILDEFHNFGTFNYPSAIEPTIVQQDTCRFVAINLFFIASSYVHLQLLYTMYAHCYSFLF